MTNKSTEQNYQIPVFVKCYFCLIEGRGPHSHLLIEESYPAKLMELVPVNNTRTGEIRPKLLPNDIHLCGHHYRTKFMGEDPAINSQTAPLGIGPFGISGDVR